MTTVEAGWAHATAHCPKHMTYGPCGGVRLDSTCEISDDPCVFLGNPVVPWGRHAGERDIRGGGPAVTSPRGLAILETMASRPVVISGMPALPLNAASIAACADLMRGKVDAVLAGDAGISRVQFPPSYRGKLIQQQGLPAWLGFNCRDRNRVALEGELAALSHEGVAGVHCVTGDHTDTGMRPDAKPVFDLESTQVIPIARSKGLLVSCAESPSSPPVADRPRRLAEKVRAGAQLALLQYCGEVEETAEFVQDARAAGADVPIIPGIPVVVDRAGAELLASFASARLPAGYVDAVLNAADPLTKGIEVALDYARGLVGVDGVGGVAIAGGAGPGNELMLAEALGVIGEELGAGS